MWDPSVEGQWHDAVVCCGKRVSVVRAAMGWSPLWPPPLEDCVLIIHCTFNTNSFTAKMASRYMDTAFVMTQFTPACVAFNCAFNYTRMWRTVWALDACMHARSAFSWVACLVSNLPSIAVEFDEAFTCDDFTCSPSSHLLPCIHGLGRPYTV